MLVFIAALERELAGLVKLIKEPELTKVGHAPMWEGEVQGNPVAFVHGGIGRELAEEAARQVILRGRPRAIVSLGFSGGVAQDVAGGDIVVGKRAWGGSDTQHIGSPKEEHPAIESDAYLLEAAMEVVDETLLPVHVGDVVSVPRLMPSADDKRTLAHKPAVKAVDMESYWIGVVAQEANIPFLPVRAASDEVDDTLPDYEKFMDDMGAINPLAAAGYFLTRPWYLFDAPRLAANARRSARNLTAFGAEFIGKVYRSAPVAQ